MLITENNRKHYVAIKSLSRLLSSQNTKHKGKEYFCMHCLQGFNKESSRDEHLDYCMNNASVNSKHQHPPGEFFKVVNSLPPGRKVLQNSDPGAKIIDKNPPGDNFVDFQDNFAMIVKPFAFVWYSSLAWFSSSFFKDYKACEYKISQ